MKSRKSHLLATLAAAMILNLVWGTCLSWAGTRALSHTPAQSPAKKLPLQNPWRVALDSKGNLYVANYGANNILVYTPAYVQKTAETITSGIDQPSGVAFDSQGNLFVSNIASSSITAYSANGAQQTLKTIINGVTYPIAIAIDGLDDVWVNNNFQYFTVYSQEGAQLGTFTPPSTPYGFATQGPFFAFGRDTEIDYQYAGEMLANANRGTEGIQSDAADAVAFAKGGTAYMGNSDGSVVHWNLYTGAAAKLIQLNYRPNGLAIDSVRGRIYISSVNANLIDVYDTSGTYLATIQQGGWPTLPFFLSAQKNKCGSPVLAFFARAGSDPADTPGDEALTLWSG